ncbi:MAG: hypothetical protein ABI806_06590 [Candidatus Solibacter sp.]
MTEANHSDAVVQITLKEFLETFPPGRAALVSGGLLARQGSYPTRYGLESPTLNLHCNACGGVRIFEKYRDDLSISETDKGHHTVDLRFLCRNCKQEAKYYALLVAGRGDGEDCDVHKFGELPEFGPPTPAKVLKLIGEEKDYYFKGRRSENQGLGIAAFAYYRRVVENQKDRIFAEIIKVAGRLGVSPDMIADLEAARLEIQFSKAVESIKHGVPQALLIKGHNPLMLLHAALSEGLHAQTDEECLALATSIRVVLADMAERIGNAMKEHTELNTAVTKLMAAKTKKPVLAKN